MVEPLDPQALLSASIDSNYFSISVLSILTGVGVVKKIRADMEAVGNNGVQNQSRYVHEKPSCHVGAIEIDYLDIASEVRRLFSELYDRSYDVAVSQFSSQKAL